MSDPLLLAGLCAYFSPASPSRYTHSYVHILYAFITLLPVCGREEGCVSVLLFCDTALIRDGLIIQRKVKRSFEDSEVCIQT
jgi:hypothetical protein